MSRTREIEARPDRVWELVSDPYHQPRWWPRVRRVEDVRGEGRRARWTQVLEAASGRGVRAEFQCVSASRPERFIWEQELEGTPFERHLAASRLEIEIEEAPRGSRVTLRAHERARGLSRLGSPMMRSAARRRLDEALDGIAESVAGGDDG